MNARIISIAAVLLLSASPATAEEAPVDPATEQSGVEIQLSDNTNPVLKDCLDGVLSHKYSQKQLRDALKEVPADAAQYTNCIEAIEDGQLSPLTKGKGVKSLQIDKDEGVTISPDEQDKIDVAKKDGAEPLSIDGVPVVPGSAGDTALLGQSLLRSLPWPVVALLALVAAGLLAITFTFVFKRGYLDRAIKFFGR